jgi:magnesium chelatase subunit D
MNLDDASRVAPSHWSDAALAAALLAVDPAGIAGVVVKGHPGPVRDRWVEVLRELLPAAAPLRRLPVHITDGRLLGGLDLAATLRSGRPVAERGVLAEADGGVVLAAMAERMAPATAARLAAVLDAGEVALERDGLGVRMPARFGVVALDESVSDDERVPAALVDRLACSIDLTGVGGHEIAVLVHDADEVAAARERLAGVAASEEVVAALCAAAMALGVASIRASHLAVRVARVAAALGGRRSVTGADAAVAARLVLAPRATRLPIADPPPDDEAREHDPEPPPDEERADDQTVNDDRPLEDRVLDAAQAAIPAGLLASLRLASGGRVRTRSSGRAGAVQRSPRRGRPAGVRRGDPRSGARLSVIETLRAAAPWQRLRREVAALPGARIQVRREDFRVARFKHRAQTTTIFVVDASGSAALHRLAEAKGAVELLLAECYVRRDRVALLAFRGRGAELLLPPTRSLVRAKRSLASLPGGGGTPLAAGIDAAAALADAVGRRGETPVVILLTDGRANVARDGAGGRARAEEEALAAARAMRAAGLTVLLVDTSPQPQPAARAIATEMSASYLPLPYADANAISAAVRSATPRSR